MLISLLKLHKPLLVFLVEPMMLYTDSFGVLFKSVNMHLVATSPLVNKVSKPWCLLVPNLVQNFLVNDQFIFVTCLLHDKCRDDKAGWLVRAGPRPAGKKREAD